MRIVQVVSEFLPHEWGGTQIHVRDLCHGLRARGHEALVFTRLRGEELEEYTTSRSEWEGIPVTSVTNNFLDADRFEMIYANPKLDARFAAYLWETRPDVVHFHHFTCLSTTLMEVCAERGIPTLVTLHDYWLVCPRGQRFHPVDHSICETLDRGRCARCLEPMWPHLLPIGEPADFADPHLRTSPSYHALRRWELHVARILDLAALVITPARFHRERYVEWGLDPSRCVVVPHGLAREALVAEPRGTRAVRTIGYLGAVTPSKGAHVLVDAFGLLARPDLALSIHGQFQVFHGDASYPERVRARIVPGQNVRLHGAYRQDELSAILAGLDLLVVPSVWWESFCLTAREGALAGLPVVVSDLGGLHDAVEDGLALGFVAGDAVDLARVLTRLLDDERLRDEMSRRAHLVRALDDCVAETEGHYAAVLERARAAPAEP